MSKSAKSLMWSLKRVIENQMERGSGQFGDALEAVTFDDNGIGPVDEDQSGLLVVFKNGDEFQIAIDRQD